MKQFLYLLGVTAIVTSPVAPSGCVTLTGGISIGADGKPVGSIGFVTNQKSGKTVVPLRQ